MTRGHSTTTWIKFYPSLTPQTLEWTKMDTIKSSAVDQSTIQFWTLGQRSQYISINFPLTHPAPSSFPRSYWMTSKEKVTYFAILFFFENSPSYKWFSHILWTHINVTKVISKKSLVKSSENNFIFVFFLIICLVTAPIFLKK